MNRLAVGAAAGAGAAISFFADRRSGARRRALVRGKLTRARHTGAAAAEATARDARNRAKGVLFGAWSRVKPDHADDSVIVERVRTAMGPSVGHSSAVHVAVADGVATLEGVVLAREVDALLRAVRRVRGVRHVENKLAVHQTAGAVPALQGSGSRPRRMRRHWSPTTRLATIAGGTGLLVAAARRRGIAGAALGLAGAMAVARAALDKPVKRIVGIGAGRRAVDVQKTITIEAPADAVYQYWRRVENLPLFMAHVRDVRANADGSYHWVVDGPAGTTAEWDAVITDEQPGRLLAWRTQPGSAVQHAGIVRFTPRGGATEVDVRLSYNPVAGEVGHATAKLFRRDPRTQITEDLMRLKTAMETGRRPHDAARAAR